MAKQRVSKYDGAIILKETLARQSWRCYDCGGAINPGERYFRQSLGLIRKPIGVRFNAFCWNCKDSSLAKKLERNRENNKGGSTANATQNGIFSVSDTGHLDDVKENQQLHFWWNKETTEMN